MSSPLPIKTSKKMPINIKKENNSKGSLPSSLTEIGKTFYDGDKLMFEMDFGDEDKIEDKPFLIGIVGGSASGKTTVCKQIIQLGELDEKEVSLISQDSFYKNLSKKDKLLADAGKFDFDHPDSIDYDQLLNVLNDLQRMKTVSVPIYDFKNHARSKDTITVEPTKIVIVEGILIFNDPRIRNLFDMKLFVDTDNDTRLLRRIRRDIKERGRSVESVLNQWEKFVKPSFDEFILPTKKYADIIIPKGGSNGVAIKLIVDYLKYKTKEI